MDADTPGTGWGIRGIALRFEFIIDDDDVRRVKAFIDSWRNDFFVQERIRRNLATDKAPIRCDQFWLGLVQCVLTSQQPAGPHSAVTRFQNLNPFPLTLEACEEASDLTEYARKTLSEFGGLRFTNKIPAALAAWSPYVTGDGWNQTSTFLERVRTEQTKESERDAARFIAGRFHLVGPKQSRNILQYLGLTRFEIPLDSRITKRLMEFGFPVHLSASLLSDSDYYEFVLDGVQTLCAACGESPCVFDAALFASFDSGGWTKENLVG